MIKDIPSVNYTLKLAAIATLLIGLSLVAIPGFLLKWFGVDPYGNDHFAVYLGTALIGFSVTNWLYSNMHDAKAVLPAVYGNIISLTIGSLIDIGSLWSGDLGRNLWLVLTVHLAFLVAFVFSALKIRRFSSHAH